MNTPKQLRQYLEQQVKRLQRLRPSRAVNPYATQDTGEGHIPAAREAWRREKESQ